MRKKKVENTKHGVGNAQITKIALNFTDCDVYTSDVKSQPEITYLLHYPPAIYNLISRLCKAINHCIVKDIDCTPT